MPWSPFYVDDKPPFPQNTVASTTLTTVNQNIYPNSHLPNLQNFFNYAGKGLYIRGFGVCTSGATPGNFGINFYCGNNTANNGTNLGGVSYTWTASQTNTQFCFEAWVRCRGTNNGATLGTLFGYGNIFIAGSGILHWPFTNPGSISLDLTSSFMISPQVNRSGSTAETIAPYHIFHQVLN